MSEWRQIKAKKVSLCEVCNRKVPMGETIYWSRTRSVIRCEADRPIELNVGDSNVVGIAGGSARKKYKSKANWDEDAINKRFPKLGRLLNLLNDDPQSTLAWKQGAVGEENVGDFLAQYAKEQGFILLNDRRIRGLKVNIDHILITDKAIFVIDAKNYRGLITVELVSMFSRKEILRIDGKDRTKLALSVQKQVGLVRSALEGLKICEDSVQGVLAFFDAEWPLISPPKQIFDVKINGRKGLIDLIQKHSGEEKLDIKKVSNILIEVFPAA